MRKYTTYVGMDVHARSIEASAVDIETGEVFNRSFGHCPQAGDVAEWLVALPQPLYCAYESGCTEPDTYRVTVWPVQIDTCDDILLTWPDSNTVSVFGWEPASWFDCRRPIPCCG